MIAINRVYDTVLDVLNKEQRGDLPPSKFNNIAHLSQLDLFNNLMYDLSHFKVSPKGDMNIKDSLMEKINVFRRRVALTYPTGTVSGSTFQLPDNYMIDTIEYTYKSKTYVAEEVSTDVYRHISNTDKAMVTPVTPKYVRLGSTIMLNTGETNPIVTNVFSYYIKQPSIPKWNAIELGAAQVPMYNSTTSVDFELHQSQEDELIKRILFYAGVAIRQEGVSSAVFNDEAQEQKIEKQ